MTRSVSVPRREEFSTGSVARLLGLAVSSVQLMVDRGDLHGWKTSGGHRRISRASVMQWLEHQQRGSGPLPIPVRDMPIHEPSVAYPINSVPQRQLRYPQRVLLIEDSMHFQALTKLFLDQEFPQVDLHVASDGFDGLVMAGRLDPDVMIIDILLPSIDGAALLARLRVSPFFRNCCFIVLTALDKDQLSPYAFALRGIPVVHKPRLMVELPALLTELLAPIAEG